MATEEEIDGVVEEANQFVADLADDPARFSQEESAQIYEGVAQVCSDRAVTIREEMGG